MLAGDAEPPTIWNLMRRIPSLRWVAIQVGLAALMAALARAPRLGRPRPDPPSGADRPAEHALALGTLLARAKAAPEAHELLDRYRRWRFPRTSRAGGDSSRFHGRWCPVLGTTRRLTRPLKLDFSQKAILEWMTTRSIRTPRPT